jgi:hypothetical protein
MIDAFDMLVTAGAFLAVLVAIMWSVENEDVRFAVVFLGSMMVLVAGVWGCAAMVLHAAVTGGVR